MTSPILTFEEVPLGANGSAKYNRKDFALVYSTDADLVPAVSQRRGRLIDHEFNIYVRPVFLIADTLTLRFDEDRVLVGLDAYTNNARWDRAELSSALELQGIGRL